MFYDLFRPAPVYGNTSFDFLYDVMEAEYTYDVNNLRIKKDVEGVVTGFVYDNGQVVLQFDGAGNVTNRNAADAFWPN